jgi:hypothetical protein
MAVQPSAHILMARDQEKRRGIDEGVTQRQWPKTRSYLKRFEHLLRQRGSQSARGLTEQGPFYSMLAIGEYTFAPWKLVWREVSTRFEPAVIGASDGRVVIPDHTVVLIPCASDEARYVCGVLASPLVSAIDQFVSRAAYVATRDGECPRSAL